MVRLFSISTALITSLILAACSSDDTSKSAKNVLPLPPTAGFVMADNQKNLLAKYLEAAGFRLSESKQGKLTVRFQLINHSDADVNSVELSVRLKPTTAKPDEPPFCEFPVKVAAIAPQGVADATGECTTKLRVYELPDWQFIRPSFTIVAPTS